MHGVPSMLGAMVLALALGAPSPVMAGEGADPGAWTYVMERQRLRDRVRVLIDGETALEAPMRFMGNRREAQAEARFRGRELRVRCMRNPLVDALNCRIWVDGVVRSSHVIVQ